MSFSQFGYPYNSSSQFLVPTNASTMCYESPIPRSLPDVSVTSSQTSAICCPSYENRLLVSTRTDLTAALGVYNTPYTSASTGYTGYLPCSTDPTTLYPALTSQYEVKDGSGSLHPGIAQPAAFYPYDHSLGQYQYDRFGALDFTVSARRKNATRETTSTLKTWLYEHRKNPYPTKGEKIMLAIITKMTLTQVSTWFANARRRLKKENKMTWSPKTKGGDERKDDRPDIEESSLESEDPDDKMSKREKGMNSSGSEALDEASNSLDRDTNAQCHSTGVRPSSYPSRTNDCSLTPNAHTLQCKKGNTEDLLGLRTGKKNFQGYSEHVINCECVEKPKIWSLAHTAGANIIVDAESDTSRSVSQDYVFVRRRHSTHGLCDDERSMHSVKTQIESSFEEMSQSTKILRTSTFNLQSFQLSCPYPVLGETCEYPSGVEGILSMVI